MARGAIEHGLPVVRQDDDYAQMRRAHPALRLVALRRGGSPVSAARTADQRRRGM